MKLANLIRAEKAVEDYGLWRSGHIDHAAWPLKKKKIKLSSDWSWRVIRLKVVQGRDFRVLLRLNVGLEQFYAILGEVHDNGIAVLCSHDLHTSHGNWHCHATVKEIEEVFVGAWRDKDSLRRWPDYNGDSTVDFDVDASAALEHAAKLYRFELSPQSEMF